MGDPAGGGLGSAYLPTTPRLLAAVAGVLDEAMSHVPAHLTHRVRVAANLVRLVEREESLGPATQRAMAEALRAVPGVDPSMPDGELLAAVADLVRTTDEGDVERSVWIAMREVTRLELVVAKPGYAAWEEG